MSEIDQEDGDSSFGLIGDGFSTFFSVIDPGNLHTRPGAGPILGAAGALLGEASESGPLTNRDFTQGAASVAAGEAMAAASTTAIAFAAWATGRFVSARAGAQLGSMAGGGGAIIGAVGGFLAGPKVTE